MYTCLGYLGLFHSTQPGRDPQPQCSSKEQQVRHASGDASLHCQQLKFKPKLACMAFVIRPTRSYTGTGSRRPTWKGLGALAPYGRLHHAKRLHSGTACRRETGEQPSQDSGQDANTRTPQAQESREFWQNCTAGERRREPWPAYTQTPCTSKQRHDKSHTSEPGNTQATAKAKTIDATCLPGVV